MYKVSLSLPNQSKDVRWYKTQKHAWARFNHLVAFHNEGIVAYSLYADKADAEPLRSLGHNCQNGVRSMWTKP